MTSADLSAVLDAQIEAAWPQTLASLYAAHRATSDWPDIIEAARESYRAHREAARQAVLAWMRGACGLEVPDDFGAASEPNMPERLPNPAEDLARAMVLGSA